MLPSGCARCVCTAIAQLQLAVNDTVMRQCPKGANVKCGPVRQTWDLGRNFKLQTALYHPMHLPALPGSGSSIKTGAAKYVAVIEEAIMPNFLRSLSRATTPTGSTFPTIPAGVIVLPGTASIPESPAPKDPLALTASAVDWNVPGSDLLNLTFPCPVFLAPTGLADGLRAKAQRNVDLVRLLSVGWCWQ